MDKMCFAPIAGKFRPLNFSMEVMFDAAEKFGSMSQCFEVLDKENREGAEAVRWLITRMVNDAELVRRQEGYDHDRIFGDDEIVISRPAFYRIYKQAVLKAIEIGYTREVEDPKEEVDLILQELNAKKDEAGN